MIQYLSALDLSEFNHKAPPPKTPAFQAIVHANSPPEDSELASIIEMAGTPDAITLEDVMAAAKKTRLHEFAAELKERKNRRSVPHKMERAGYTVVANPDAKDGLWKVANGRTAIYARTELSPRNRIVAARDRCRTPRPPEASHTRSC